MAISWVDPTRPLFYHFRDQHRELVLQGPRGTLILVGRDIRRPREFLFGMLTTVVLTGFGILAIGLIGGAFLSKKLLNPIDKICQTATKIEGVNLHERIDVQHMDVELQGLAKILNEMWDRLQHSFQQQAQFTADASHELRTPLAVLLSHCELALSRPRPAQEYAQTLETCQQAARRMKSLVNDLLLLARSDAGALELERESIDLHELAQEAVEALGPLSQSYQVQLHLEGNSAPCLGDAARLMQVLNNLLKNAIAYNHPQGNVFVRTSMDEQHALLEVEDTGSGIDAKDLPRLFDRFYRVDEARSRDTGGSGLGLAISKSIVDAHHGTIEVTSQVGTGSKFLVKIPRSL